MARPGPTTQPRWPNLRSILVLWARIPTRFPGFLLCELVCGVADFLLMAACPSRHPLAEKGDRALPCAWESAAPRVASRCPAHHTLPQAPGCCDPALLLEPRRVCLGEHRTLRGHLAEPPGAASRLSSGDEGQGPQGQPSSRRKGTLETRDPETWARVPGAEV